jgi:oxysterol-binding protein-related protein 8
MSSFFDECVPDPENTLGGIKNDTDPPAPSVIMHMVKSLMPGQDLTRVTIPPFFLEPRSLLERMADLMMHPDLLLGVAKLQDPLGRMAAILRWYLSGWHYKTTGVKKPYNPIVGETFACFWKHSDGSKSQYFAEQVGHRPPISAIHLENRPNDFVLSSFVWTKSQFQAPQTTKSILDGGCLVTLTNISEDYFLTLPTFFAHNLLLGKLRMEIGDSTAIICVKTGLRCDINFHQRTMFSDEKLTMVDATISKIGADGRSKGETLCSFSGHWDSVIQQTFGASVTPLMSGCAVGVEGLDVSSKGAPFIDVTKLHIAPKYTLPINKMGPWESRRLWQFCTQELLKRPIVDWGLVDREKGQLEEEQRLLPCHQKESSSDYVPWTTKKFHPSKIVDLTTGKERDFYIFDDKITTPYIPSPEEDARCFIKLSRDLPDQRGGIGNAGAVDTAVALMKTISLSERRVKDRDSLRETSPRSSS